MYKIGQNVTVGYPDRNSAHKPGVIYNKTQHENGEVLYWVRVMERNGVMHVGDTYYESDVLKREPTADEPNPEDFSVGSDIVINGERWTIRGVTGTGDDSKFEVYEYGLPLRVVAWSDIA